MRYLGARKSQGGVGLIAGISFACIMLAIAAMIIIMSIMNGFREELVGRMLGAQGHVYMETYQESADPLEINKTSEWLNTLDDVDLAMPILNKQVFVTANGQGTGGLVRGVRLEDLAQLSFVTNKIQFGSLEDFGVGEYGGDTIAIGLQMAVSLGVSIGDQVTLISPIPKQTAFGSSLTRKSYQVGAIFSLGLLEADSLHIYMPLEQGLLFFDAGTSTRDIEIRLKKADKVKGFSAYLRENGPQNMRVYDWMERAESIAGALRIEQVAMRMILCVVGIIAIFPVVAAMIMLVKNKGKDIAILRTIGATRGSILRIFFMSGFVIGAVGTLTGLIIGVLFCLNIGVVQTVIEFIIGGSLFPADVYELTDGIPAIVKWGEVAWVTIWGFILSSAATFFPAWTASKLDPVEALRFE